MFGRSKVLFALPLAVVACSMPPRVSEERALVVEHRAQSALHVTGRNGAVKVAVDPSIQEVQIGVKVTASGDTEEAARARLQSTQIRTERDAEGGLHLEAVFAGGKQSGDGCAFDVRIPSLSEIRVDTSNGSVTVSDTEGVAWLDTSNGAVRVERHAGDLTVRTSNGGVTVTTVDGAVDVASSNGGIDIDDVAGVVRAETSNGGIELRSAESRNQAFHLDTSNGRVEIVLPGSPRATVHCHTSNRSIRTEGGPIEESGSKRDRRIVVGGGGPESMVETSNGSITLRLGH